MIMVMTTRGKMATMNDGDNNDHEMAIINDSDNKNGQAHRVPFSAHLLHVLYACDFPPHVVTPTLVMMITLVIITLVRHDGA